MMSEYANVKTKIYFKAEMSKLNRVLQTSFLLSCLMIAHLGQAQKMELVPPLGHSDIVTSVAFSPDGQYVISGSHDGTVKLWQVITGRLLHTFLVSDKWILSVAFSPDGRIMASGTYDGTVKLWQVNTGLLLRTFIGHAEDIRSIAFSPNRQYLGSGSNDKTIRLWQVSTGKLLHTFTGLNANVKSIAFSPNGQNLISAVGKTLKLWQVETKQLLRTFSGHTSNIISVAFSPNGQYVAGAGSDGIKLWQANTGKLIHTIATDAFTDAAKTFAFSPDGRFIAIGSFSKPIRLWQISTRQITRFFKDSTNKTYAKTNALAFSPDGRYMISAFGNTLKHWQVNNGKLIRTFIWHAEDIRSIAFSPNRQYVASGSDAHTFRVWNINTGQLFRTATNHVKVRNDYSFVTNGVDKIWSVAFSPDGSRLLSGSDDGTIKLWQTNSVQLLSTFSGHLGSVLSVAFSTSGKMLASGSSDKTVKLWQASTGKVIHTFKGHANVVSSVAFSPNGEIIASGSWDNTLKLWQISTGQLLRTFKVWRDFYTSVAYSPDGQYVVSGSTDSTLKLWQVSYPEQLLHTFKGHRSWVSSVAFSPSGQYLISGSDDSTLKLWQVSNKQLLKTFSGHTGTVTSVAYSPDGQYVVSGSTDSTLKLWQVSNKQLLKTFSGHTGTVTSVAYSPDGQYVVSGSTDSTLKLWQVSNKQQLKTFAGHTGTVTSVAYSPDGQYVVSGSTDSTLKLWQFSNKQLLKTFTGHTGTVTSVAYSQNGRYVASGSNDKSICYWNVSSGQLERDAKVQTSGVSSLIISSKGKYLISDSDEVQTSGITSVAFSPDGFNLVSTSDNNILKSIVSNKYSYSFFGNREEMVSAVAFSPNGQYVVSGSWDNTLRLWQASTGRLLNTLNGHKGWINSVAFSPDGQYLLSTSMDMTVKLWQVNTGKLLNTLTGHRGYVWSAAFSSDGKKVISGSSDGTIKFWEIRTNQEVANLFAIDSTNYLFQLPSKHFKSSRNATKLIHYVTPDLKVVTFDQLDIRYNRPDKVLRAIGCPDTAIIDAYHKAYQKRIKRLNIDTTNFHDDFAVPQVDFVNRNKIRYELNQPTLTLDLRGQDSTYLLNRFNVWVNEAPLFGIRGISLKSRNKNTLDTTLTIALTKGINSIEVSVYNTNGIESYRMPLVVNYTPTRLTKAKLYFVGIGIDKFLDSTHNLSWSVQDIRKLAAALKEKYQQDMVVDTLFNQRVTVDSVRSLKERLLQSSIHDKVIVAYSGHGLLSKDYDYFLSTYDTNFDKPQEGGLPYDVLESLLDSIPARQKLMLLDACHSGEVDKEEMARYKWVQAKLDSSGVLVSKPGNKGSGKAKGTELAESDSSRVGMKNSFELMQELFVNVGRSTGATVISAAAGTQFALERNNLENGVFTYSILEYLRQQPAGKVSELRRYVNQRVSELTEGLQVPTTRSETLNYDWYFW